jgi:hypothetical protein
VLLVGDGTLDPKRYRSNSTLSILPPYLEDVDPWAGETAADNRYVTVDGADSLPDLLVGRLPANTAAEVQAMVSKIVDYERAAYSSGWNRAVLFVADNADSAGGYPGIAQRLAAAHVPAPFVANQITYDPAEPAGTSQQRLLAAWRAGLGLVVFTGHASTHQWAVERLLHDSEVPALANGQRLPVAVELTCFTGSFHIAGLPTLDETLVREPAGGAVAVLGATGLGVATGHEVLAAAFLDAAYGGQTLGTATLAGKLAVAAHQPGAADLIDTFGLLGDPATRLFTNLTPWPQVRFLPLMHR